jgi:hypothetical protein
MTPLAWVYLFHFVTNGMVVLCSYYIFWPAYDIRAGLKNTRVFMVWACSALTAAVAFLVYSIELVVFLADADTQSKEYEIAKLGLISYIVFGYSSALYMPFTKEKRVTETLVDLAVAAITAIFVAITSGFIFGPTHHATILLCFLAAHCLFFDLFYWGKTWYDEVKDEDYDYIDLDHARESQGAQATRPKSTSESLQGMLNDVVFC